MEALSWLGLLVLDLATASAQVDVARRMPLANMSVWIALTAIACAALLVASLFGVRAGRGAIGGRLPAPLGAVALGLGMVLRMLLWLGLLVWVTTMSGLQSV